MKSMGIVLLLFLAAMIAIAQDRAPFRIPADPSTPVITLEYRGGGPRPPSIPAATPGPTLTVQAGGRVVIAGQPSGADLFLTATQLQDLLHFIIDDQDLIHFNADSVKAEIARQSGTRRMAVADASDTIVRIRTADTQFEAAYNAVNLWVMNYPGIRALTQLQAVENRLRTLLQQVKSGQGQK